ncbi:hypothetical protein WMY93_030044 [Mugilogobius chulae]|uniref:Netrin-G1 n=1 Tax=Mugilogobius chulae TaxID=88201 RepID=A0AAW0MNH9_9GOBI
MVLEKSLDYGRTWQPYQFYATDCLDAFTMEPKTVRDLTQHTLLDIICTEDYSRGYVWKYDKTVRFEIKDRFALFAGPRLHNMASLYGQLDTTKNLRDFFTITDLRPGRIDIVHCLLPGAELAFSSGPGRVYPPPLHFKVASSPFQNHPPDQLSSFYHLYEQFSSGLCFQDYLESIGFRRCKCNLHANSCVYDKEKLSCECEHNTTGPDCGRCKRNYQGRAWSAGSYLPIPKGTANIYCNCNQFGSVSDRCNGTGFCICKEGTTGPKCQDCLPGYMWDNGCKSRVCDNELLRCQNGGVCVNNVRCNCPAAFTGILCEKARCENELGGCAAPNSGQAPTTLGHFSKTLLLCCCRAGRC